nr:methyl-accepting chemotaxis protein [uncultured Desulfuromonas sp.]
MLKRFPLRVQLFTLVFAAIVIFSVVGSLHNPLFLAVAVVLYAIPASLYILGLVQDVERVMNQVDETEKGHYDLRNSVSRQDVLGKLANAANVLNSNFETVLLPTLNKLGAGDITFNPKPRDPRDGTRLALKSVSDRLNETVSNALTGSADINSSAARLGDTSTALTKTAAEQANSLEKISSTMDDLATQIAQNADNSEKANTFAAKASDSAATGQAKMSAMIDAIQEISTASKSISQIIKVIDEIAFQTNLLALNAAVEAARAGQHGKGFAVVAEEVRNLAARSAKAAGETAALITGSEQKTAAGVAIAHETADSLKQIATETKEVVTLISEIASASKEQADSISQINEGIGHLDTVSQQNSATADECAAIASEVLTNAGAIHETMRNFQLREDFANHVPKAAIVAPPAVTPPQTTKAATRAKQGWGETTSNEQIAIALDDGEFGRY